jgi:hypothetical protein
MCSRDGAGAGAGMRTERTSEQLASNLVEMSKGISRPVEVPERLTLNDSYKVQFGIRMRGRHLVAIEDATSNIKTFVIFLQG